MLAMLFLDKMNKDRRIASEKRVKFEQNPSDSVYCRTCLNTENLVSIFHSSDSEEKMSHNLKVVTGLQVKMNDGLSQKICTRCLKIFNHTLQFRRKCKEAAKTLLKMLSREPITSNHSKPMKYSIKLNHKAKIKKVEKVEQEEYNNYEDMMYADSFQNDDDFDCKEDVKPIYVVQEQNPSRLLSVSAPQEQPMKIQPLKIPNASSYKCNSCDKEFRMKTTYRAHMRFHTNYYVCEACGKRCRNNNQLQEHKRALHGLGKIHKCAYCEYSSATKEALTIHERRHTGERPYICDHCGGTFHRRSNLVQHIAIHLPERNFQCNFCPRREKSRKRLQIHVYKRHRARRYSYKCPRCYKLFVRNEHTHRHLARVHHIPRSEHPPIERILLDNTDASYRPLPYQYEQTEYSTGQGNALNAVAPVTGVCNATSM